MSDIKHNDVPDMGHDADGIRELDNFLPRWWLWLLYITILFGVIYLLVYHVFQTAPLQEEQWRQEMAAAKQQVEQYRAGQIAAGLARPASTEPSADPAVLALGRELFETKSICWTCHAKDGGGMPALGPNLTDGYMINGHDFADAMKVITDGSPKNPVMIAWKAQLKPDEIYAVASHVWKLQGTTPAVPKPPEGLDKDGHPPGGAAPAPAAPAPAPVPAPPASVAPAPAPVPAAPVPAAPAPAPVPAPPASAAPAPAVPATPVPPAAVPAAEVPAPAVTEPAKDPAVLALGKEIFETKSICWTCHGKEGGGMPALGPNLTDTYKLNGHSFADMLKVVTDGSPKNPLMVPWKAQLKPEEIYAVASHAWSLMGTTSPTPKPPEGVDKDGNPAPGWTPAPAVPAPAVPAPTVPAPAPAPPSST